MTCVSTLASPVIVRKDALGGLRVWSYEVRGNQYRTISGTKFGMQTPSSWTICAGKQGRSDAEQAQFEANAMYVQKLDREYRLTEAELSSVPTSPMLAKKYSDEKDRVANCFKSGAGVYTQPKLDGIRAKTTRAGAFSREFQRHLNVEHILEALAPLFAKYPDLEFDGELYNHDLREDFNKIASVVRKQKPDAAQREIAAGVIQYHIYDLPSCKENFGLRAVRLMELLHELGAHPSIVYVQTAVVPDQALLDIEYGKYLEQGYEGQMVRIDAPYDFDKRSKFLLKRKEFETAEFPLVAIEEGSGNWAGYAKRVVFRLPDGRECGAGIKGNQTAALKLLKDFPAWGPNKAVTIRSFKATPDGMPRFPVALDFHPEGRAD